MTDAAGGAYNQYEMFDLESMPSKVRADFDSCVFSRQWNDVKVLDVRTKCAVHQLPCALCKTIKFIIFSSFWVIACHCDCGWTDGCENDEHEMQINIDHQDA